MSERRSSADLGLDLEAALRSFPLPERDWESQVLAAEARLPHAGATDDALLAAPFPREPGEPSESSESEEPNQSSAPIRSSLATSTPLTHSGVRPQSLAEMARRSVEKKQTAEREMAREALALAAKRPSAVEVQALREMMSHKLAGEPSSSAAASRAPGSEPRAAVSPEHAAARPSARGRAGSTAWSRLGLTAAGVAMAAGLLFWLRQPARVTPLGTPSATATAIPSAAEAARSISANAPAANPTQPAETPAAVPTGVSPDTLPEAEPRGAPPTHEQAAAARAPAPGTRAPKPEKIELEDQAEKPVATSPTPPRAELPVAQALPADPALRPADSTGGAVPAKPSSGAVQAALGAVMSGARRCLAGEDTPSSALVVFGSDGRVQSVSVSGPAAGRPSGGCIEAQLSRARVQPFAASSFSVSAMVRPD